MDATQLLHEDDYEVGPPHSDADTSMEATQILSLDDDTIEDATQEMHATNSANNNNTNSQTATQVIPSGDSQSSSAPLRNSSSTNRAQTPCKYGANCYRKDLEHLRTYSHPPKLKSSASSLPSTASLDVIDLDDEDAETNSQKKRKREELTSSSTTKRARVEGEGEKIKEDEGKVEGEGEADGEKGDIWTPPRQKPVLQRRHSSQTMLDMFITKHSPLKKGESQRVLSRQSSGLNSATSTTTTNAPQIEGSSTGLPASYKDVWDDHHVRMPCSPHNTYVRTNASSRLNNKRRLSRWYLIKSVLATPIRNTRELQEAIIAFNCTKDSRYAQYWEFSGLHDFFNSFAADEESRKFFRSTLPFIIRHAFRLPELFPEAVPLLEAETHASLTLSQEQVACLLANAFLCTFPTQGPKATAGKKKEEYPSFGFSSLFMGCGTKCLPNQAAKLRCVINYFERVAANMPRGNITYQRVVLEEEISWHNSKVPIISMTVSEGDLIEDQHDCLQVDFANKMVGGGVLGFGCIQEEIRFMINTELIASLLFTARLRDNECLLITGSERFCKYTGYAKTFRFNGDYVDTTPRDTQNRRLTQVVAMDALHFGASRKARQSQYKMENITRELSKCYCSFSAQVDPDRASLSPIATGNWGCGAFGGYHDIKIMIQLMAASQAGRPLRYTTYHEPGLADSMRELHALLVCQKATVSDLWTIIEQVSRSLFTLPVAKEEEEDEGEGEGEADTQPMYAEEALTLVAPQLFNIAFDHFETRGIVRS